MPQRFESIGSSFTDYNGKTRQEVFAPIYESMLQSNAFTSLNHKQQMLYIYCKLQYYGKRKPKRDYPEIDAFNSDDCFYFNWKTAQSYKLYKENSSANFYRDMNSLISHGLIERISSGAKHRTKSIYKYSTKWTEYPN